jgi:hypothetical protein
LDDQIALERWRGFDHLKWKSLATSCLVGVREDGTLWADTSARTEPETLGNPMHQIGTAMDWIAVTMGIDGLVALKANGSLWEWKLAPGMADRSGFVPAAWEFLAKPPARLGGKTDWVAISGQWGAVASLAADGNLWYWWPAASAYREEGAQEVEPWLMPSRKPVKVANIFGEH